MQCSTVWVIVFLLATISMANGNAFLDDHLVDDEFDEAVIEEDPLKQSFTALIPYTSRSEIDLSTGSSPMTAHKTADPPPYPSTDPQTYPSTDPQTYNATNKEADNAANKEADQAPYPLSDTISDKKSIQDSYSFSYKSPYTLALPVSVVRAEHVAVTISVAEFVTYRPTEFYAVSASVKWAKRVASTIFIADYFTK